MSHTTPHRLEVQNADIGYGDKTVLHDLTFNVPHGARVAVVGPNGAGKSTLFKALVGLLPVQKGSIRVHSLPLSAHKDCVAYIPQREEVDWRFPVTVNDVVMMGRFDRQGWFGSASRADKQVVERSLKQMGVADLARRSISDLSGGQQQRVFLARALAQEPHILLMDEPFTGVDVTTQEATLALLDDLRAADVTAMISTHDLNLASSKFDLMLLLNHRLIAFGKPDEVMRQSNLATAFGSHLTVLSDGSVVVDNCCPPEEN
ncbi:MAG TPA: metal ABC transporter ATP-binding protein [Anaerolineales bacterium]|jgi:ABC-type Mn2+/Zn2+ transport system ATPase subunit|nr:metal ABC transporter ATP-binding protein [Anaerolineales bacterium]